MSRILIVEDEPDIALGLQLDLRSEGYGVEICADGEDASRRGREQGWDLILLDVMLPDVNGFDILASLRKHPAFQRVPVMMITGKATREAVLKGLAWGADGYITKPFEPDALMTAVRTVLGLPQPARR